MEFGLISFHLQNTPMFILEKLSFSEDDAIEFVRKVTSGCPSVTELIVLSTCNRTEFYFSISGNYPEIAAQVYTALFERVAEYSGLPVENFKFYAKIFNDNEVIQHLFQTTAGLNSLAIGETQIQGQVKNAYQVAVQNQLVTSHLGAIFESALKAGKRVRTETRLGQIQISLSGLAIDFLTASSKFDHEINAIIIGTGKMAQLAASHMKNKGIKNIQVFSRNAESRQEKFSKYGAVVLPFSSLNQALYTADIVFSAYGSEVKFIDKTLLSQVNRKSGHALHLIDIAMPRDIDTDVLDLADVKLIDFTEIKSNGYRDERLSSDDLARAAEILHEEMDEYYENQRIRQVSGVISALRQKVTAAGETELNWALRRFENLDQHDQQILEKLINKLTSRILREPTRVLREKASAGQAAGLMQSVGDLFDIRVQN